jgi:hypothetical protein
MYQYAYIYIVHIYIVHIYILFRPVLRTILAAEVTARPPPTTCRATSSTATGITRTMGVSYEYDGYI